MNQYKIMQCNFSDTDLFDQSVLLNLGLVKDLDRNMIPRLHVLCEPDLCKGSFPDCASKLILADAAPHLK